jgi:K+-transporting ATPase KdpF subunit
VPIHGHSISNRYAAVFRGGVGLRETMRTLDGWHSMTILTVFAGVIALALLIYLFVAMLKPEAFE